MPSEGHGIGVPALQPVLGSQASCPLQLSPSEQEALFGACVHVFSASLQASPVQETPSSQLTGAPAWQPSAALHTSTPLQNTPSLQGTASGVCVHAFLASLHASAVQAIASLQSTGAPAAQPVSGAPLAR